MKDLISVIIPVYMVEDYLDKCIKSVTEQSYTNLEIIIINDGSKDGSSKIIDDYSLRDSRIISIKQSNQGLSSARNRGLEIATGKFLMFVDSDDWIEKNCIKYLYDKLNEYDLDISACAARCINELSNESHIWCQSGHKIFDSEFAIKNLLTTQKYCIDPVQQKLYKSSLFKNLRFEVGRHHEDTFITTKLLGESKKSGYFDEPLYNYLIRNNSIGNTTYSIKQFDKIYAFLSLEVYISNKYQSCLPYLYARILSFSMYNYIMIIAYEGDNQNDSLDECYNYLRKYANFIKYCSFKVKILLILLLINRRFFNCVIKMCKSNVKKYFAIVRN